jgi:hypothetical protein
MASPKENKENMEAYEKILLKNKEDFFASELTIEMVRGLTFLLRERYSLREVIELIEIFGSDKKELSREENKNEE